MSDKVEKISASTINLYRKSRLLEMGFSDGRHFSLPCEYLRVFSPVAEVKIARQPVHGKAEANISRIEQKGNYALRLYFDDSYNTGIYSWETLYRLGEDYVYNWAEYLQKLITHGLSRGLPLSSGERVIRLLYFMRMVKIAGQEVESVTLPASATTVADLLA